MSNPGDTRPPSEITRLFTPLEERLYIERGSSPTNFTVYGTEPLSGTVQSSLSPSKDSSIPVTTAETSLIQGEMDTNGAVLSADPRPHDSDEEPVGCGSSMAGMAHNAEEYMRHMWQRRWTVVHFHHLPHWLKDNAFLLQWHRPELKSVRECFDSVFRLHSETGNIWTHLLGGVAFLSLGIFVVSRPNSKIQWEEKLAFSVYFIGAITCLCLSFLFHTLFCHSEIVSKIFSKLDYLGIVFLTIGSFAPYLHYGFYCQFYVKMGYFVAVLILGNVCVVVSMFDQFATPRYRPMRAVLFIMFGLSGVAPAVHITYIMGFWNSFTHGSLGWLGLMAILYIGGAIIYALRVPERFCPGKMDLGCQSHQLFHVFVVAAAFVHYHGMVNVAIYRLTVGDCTLRLVSPPQGVFRSSSP